MPSSPRLLGLVAVAAVGAMAGACGGPTEARPHDVVGTYKLRSIGGRALPWADTLNPNGLPRESGPSNFIFYAERLTLQRDGRAIQVSSIGYRTTPSPTVFTDTSYWVLTASGPADGRAGTVLITDSTASRYGPLTFDYRVDRGARTIRRVQYGGEWVWSR